MNRRPYWWDTVGDTFAPAGGAAAAAARRESASDRRWDVLVLGAGYTGLSAARRLAQRGASVLVVDRETIGWGASSRNGGQILTGLKLDPASLVARYGKRRARALFVAAATTIDRLEGLIDEEGIECGYRRCGHLQAAWKPSHFAAFRREQALLATQFGHRVELIGPSDQRTEIDTTRYHGLLLDGRSACVNPAQLVQGLGGAAVRAGALIHTGTGVDRIARSASGWSAWTSDGRELRASHVLVATNGYTDGAAPAVRRRLVPIGSYIIATEPLDSSLACTLLPKRRVVFDSKYFLFYFRVTDDGRLLFGGRAEFRRPDDTSAIRAAAILYRGMIDLFPALGGVRIEYAWGGRVAFTRDQMPHAGEIDGLHFAGGYCGHGIAIATECGDLMARRLCGEQVDNPLLSLDCPAIPLYNGTPWFLPLVGTYYRVKDWMS